MVFWFWVGLFVLTVPPIALGLGLAALYLYFRWKYLGDNWQFFFPRLHRVVSALAGQLKRLALDPEFRGRLRADGLKRAQTFDWQRTAAQTLELYELAHRQEGSRSAQPASSRVYTAQPSAPVPMN